MSWSEYGRLVRSRRSEVQVLDVDMRMPEGRGDLREHAGAIRDLDDEAGDLPVMRQHDEAI